MGQLKKIKNLLDSYEKLPNGSFKKTVGDDIEKIKEIYAEVHSLKKMKDRLDADVDDCMITYAKKKDWMDEYGNPIITGDSDTDELLEDERRAQEEGKKYVETSKE